MAKLRAMTNSDSSSPRPIRVRMAPSPTGLFHVGSARTTLFNFLFARHVGGAFVLRIEDTDAARNDVAFEKIIFDSLDWLGLNPDEGPLQGGAFGPYRQSERTDIYRAHAQKLVENGQAYFAYETAEELAAMRDEQRANKQPPRYNGAHRDLTLEQREAFEAQGRRGVLRLRVPEGQTAWTDAVYGPISWKNSDLDDFVIQKSDGGPTYNFACVVDDALMQISHVIRGEDGLNNTPRQIMLGQAFGWDLPIFAHLPFLLGRDRSKLSKRHATVNLLDYRDAGLYPDAMISYLALLGWNPGQGDTQELWTREELIARFSLDGVNKSGAIFDVEKLGWMNVQFLKALPLERFIELAQPYLSDFLPDPIDDYTRRALELSRERIHQLPDIEAAARPFFRDDFDLDAAAAAKHLTPAAAPRLAQLHGRLAALETWDHDGIEAAIRALATDLGIKPAELIHPSRLAVSGRGVGPSLFDLLAALGRDRVLRRLQKTAVELQTGE